MPAENSALFKPIKIGQLTLHGAPVQDRRSGIPGHARRLYDAVSAGRAGDDDDR